MLARTILVLVATAILAARLTQAAPERPGYDIVLLAGQSNMAGRGTDDAKPETPDPRLLQFGATPGTPTEGQIMPGSGPLEMPEGIETGLIGPGPTFARFYLNTLPPNRRVLLVPAAWGGTALVSPVVQNDPACGTRPCWAPGNPGGALYENAIAQANAAVAAARLAYPASRFVGTLWVQGESDADAPQALYGAALDALIAGFRARITGATDSWFIVGGMLPEYVARSSGSVAAAHVDTPRRDLRTAYSPGAAGHVFMLDGLNLHFDAAGQRINGRRMFDAVARAEANVPGTPPVAPALTAAPTPGSQTGITVSIVPPIGRATDYLLQVSVRGSGSWATIAHSPASLAQVFPVLGLKTGIPYEFRAASINDLGRSAFGPLASAAPLAVPGRAGPPRVASKPTPDSMSLAWTAPAIGTVSSYRIQYRQAGAATWLTSGVSLAPAATVSALRAGLSYEFRVLALNASGPGPESIVLRATTAPYAAIAPALRRGRYLFDHEYESGSVADQRGTSRMTLQGDAVLDSDRIGAMPNLTMTSAHDGAAAIAPTKAVTTGSVTCMVAGLPSAPVSSSGRYVLVQSVTPDGRIHIELSLVDPTTRWTALARGRATASAMLPTDGTPFVTMLKADEAAGAAASQPAGTWRGLDIGFGPETGPVSLALVFDACMEGESTQDDAAVLAAFRAETDRLLPRMNFGRPYRRRGHRSIAGPR